MLLKRNPAARLLGISYEWVKRNETIASSATNSMLRRRSTIVFQLWGCSIRSEIPDSSMLASSITVVESSSTSYCSNSELEMIAANILMLYDMVNDSVHDLVHDSAHEMEEED